VAARPPQLVKYSRGMELAVGQRWTFDAHEVDHRASVVICRLEEDGRGVHIAILDLGRTAPDGQPSFSGTNQTPIAREALERSLVRLLEADVALPADFAKDYESWKSAKGGFFTMTVAEIAAMVRASGAYQANTTKTVAATGYIKK